MSWPLVIVTTLVTSICCEHLCHRLFFSSDDFLRTKASLSQLTEKLDRLKGANKGTDDRTTADSSSHHKTRSEEKSLKKAEKEEGKLKDLEKNVREKHRRLAAIRIRSSFVTMITLFATWQTLGYFLSGVPVARLPFEPFEFLRPMTHRGLSGEDWRECSFAFLLVLSQMSIKAFISKLLSPLPPDTENPFSTFWPDEEELAAKTTIKKAIPSAKKEKKIKIIK